MLALAFLRWWYTDGWLTWWRKSLERIERLFELFSVPILVKTLFAPWKRIISFANRSLGERLRSWLDNLISRFVGLMTRLMVLMAAALCLFGLMVMSLVGALLWLMAPPLAILLILGLVG